MVLRNPNKTCWLPTAPSLSHSGLCTDSVSRPCDVETLLEWLDPFFVLGSSHKFLPKKSKRSFGEHPRLAKKKSQRYRKWNQNNISTERVLKVRPLPPMATSLRPSNGTWGTHTRSRCCCAAPAPCSSLQLPFMEEARSLLHCTVTPPNSTP